MTVSGAGVAPTGNVTLVVDSAVVQTLALVGGVATFTPINGFSVGTHTVEVDYAGDVNYFAGSDLLDGGQQVNQSSTTTAVTSSPNPSLFGQGVTFTATVAAAAPGSGTPTGNVQFVIDGANFGAPGGAERVGPGDAEHHVAERRQPHRRGGLPRLRQLPREQRIPRGWPGRRSGEHVDDGLLLAEPEPVRPVGHVLGDGLAPVLGDADGYRHAAHRPCPGPVGRPGRRKRDLRRGQQPVGRALTAVTVNYSGDLSFTTSSGDLSGGQIGDQDQPPRPASPRTTRRASTATRSPSRRSSVRTSADQPVTGLRPVLRRRDGPGHGRGQQHRRRRVHDLDVVGLGLSALDHRELSGRRDSSTSARSSPYTQDVTQAVLTVTADDISRVYGDANPTLTASLHRLQERRDARHQRRHRRRRPLDDRDADQPGRRQPLRDHRGLGHARRRATTPSTSSPARLDVTKATLTVTADDQTRDYGDANPTLHRLVHRLQERRDARHQRRHRLAQPLHARRRRPARSAAAPTRSRRPSARWRPATTTSRFVDGQLDVTKATLTVTADDQSRIYGDANPTLHRHLRRLQERRDARHQRRHRRRPRSDHVRHADQPGRRQSLRDHGGHRHARGRQLHFSFVDGDSTSPRRRSPSPPTTRRASTAMPTRRFTASFAGFKNGETLATSGVTGSPSSPPPPRRRARSPAAPTPSRPASARWRAGNYDFTFVDGTLTSPRPRSTVTADDQVADLRRRQPDVHRQLHRLQERRDAGDQRRHRRAHALDVRHADQRGRRQPLRDHGGPRHAGARATTLQLRRRQPRRHQGHAHRHRR